MDADGIEDMFSDKGKRYTFRVYSDIIVRSLND